MQRQNPQCTPRKSCEQSKRPGIRNKTHQAPLEANTKLTALPKHTPSPFALSTRVTRHPPPRTGEGTNPGMLSASATKRARASSTLRRSEGSLAAHSRPISIIARWVSVEAHVTATTAAKLSAYQHNIKSNNKPNEQTATHQYVQPHGNPSQPAQALPWQCGTRCHDAYPSIAPSQRQSGGGTCAPAARWGCVREVQSRPGHIRHHGVST